MTRTALLAATLATAVSFVPSQAFAQDTYRYHDRDYYRVARLEPGTAIPVRSMEGIDVAKGDYRVYRGTVDRDVSSNNGRLVIPAGSQVEMMVRFQPDGDLNLDLESVIINGTRFAVRTDQQHFEAGRDNSLVGNILGAINGGSFSGRAVHIPRDSVIQFRLARPLDTGISDRGVDRDGYHYHDYYRDNGRR